MRAPGRLIDVGGYRLHLDDRGAGSPAVIFDAALGASSLSWSLVQPEVAAFTRACSYDRAGFGWSDPGPMPRTTARIVDELRMLLDRAAVPPPYVLVGHSYGGLTARLFAAQRPGDVAGLVLLDPAYPEDWHDGPDQHRHLIEKGARLCRYGAAAARLGIARLVAMLASRGAITPARALVRLTSRGGLQRADEEIIAPLAKLPPPLRPVAINFWTQAKFFEALGAQIASMPESCGQVAESGSIGNVPLVVISGQTNSNAGQLARQERLARSSPNGRHVVAEHSGHWIPLDRPDVVVDAIRQVVGAPR